MQAVAQTSKANLKWGRIHDDRPQRFKKSRKRAVAKRNQVMKTKALNTFLTAVSQPYFFTLIAKDLDIAKELAQASNLYNATSLEFWRKQLKATFKGCFYFALEVGQGDFNSQKQKRGLVHAHVMAARDDGPDCITRDSRKCEKVTHLKGLLEYLNKNPESYSLEAQMDYQATRMMSESRRAPRTRGWYFDKKRQQWNRENGNPITLWPFD